MQDQRHKQASPLQPTFAISLAAGGCAGTAVDVALFPLDTLKTRLQAPEGFFKAGGFRGVYNGLLSAAAGSAPGAALFFGTYDYLKRAMYRNVEGGETSKYAPLIHMGSSAVGECTACLVRVPTENVKQKMQAGVFQETSAALRGIRSGGLSAFYKGYFTTLTREVPFVFIQFPIYEKMKATWGAQQGSPVSALQAALCGSMAGGFAAACTTPMDVTKTRMMLGADAQGVPYTSTVDTMRRVYAEGGMPRLFSGVGPRVMWISIGGSVFFGVYEQAKIALTSRYGVEGETSSY